MRTIIITPIVVAECRPARGYWANGISECMKIIRRTFSVIEDFDRVPPSDALLVVQPGHLLLGLTAINGDNDIINSFVKPFPPRSVPRPLARICRPIEPTLSDWQLRRPAVETLIQIEYKPSFLPSLMKEFRQHKLTLTPPWSATLSWWWGLCTDDPDDF